MGLLDIKKQNYVLQDAIQVALFVNHLQVANSGDPEDSKRAANKEVMRQVYSHAVNCMKNYQEFCSACGRSLDDATAAAYDSLFADRISLIEKMVAVPLGEATRRLAEIAPQSGLDPAARQEMEGQIATVNLIGQYFHAISGSAISANPAEILAELQKTVLAPSVQRTVG